MVQTLHQFSNQPLIFNGFYFITSLLYHCFSKKTLGATFMVPSFCYKSFNSSARFCNSLLNICEYICKVVAISL